MTTNSMRHPAARIAAGILCTLFAVTLSGSAALAQARGAGAAPATLPQASESRWVGPDLKPIPLGEDELLEFLRTAEIVEREKIKIGINGIDRLTLEKDGVRLRAGFREVDVRLKNKRVGAMRYLLFRDSFIFECAAYELARLLGIPNVPPAVPRRIDRVDGSVQLWVEDLFEDYGDRRSPDALGWVHQIWTMKFFDALIYNVDRNPGNLIVDHQYRLWLIDHTRAFQRKSSPFQVEYANHVGRDVWERLQTLEREDFDQVFSGLLESTEVSFFMDRRDKLVTHIKALIAERGEAGVLF